MDRRRMPTRPASSEEVECWSHATRSLSSVSNIYASPNSVETVHRVNRLINAWPTDDSLPADGYDGLKITYKRLSSGLRDIRAHTDEEIKAIDEAMERISVLVALRKASEAILPEKRNKRPRGPSPAGTPTPATPPIATNARALPVSIPLRSSIGPSPAIPFSREPKARREALAKQLPLQEGRKVAFHPPANKPGDEGNGDAAEENTWILAVVIKSINQDKNRYEVQDAEPQEDGQPGQRYNTTLRAIIPLPDPTAPSTSAAHLNAYQEFPTGSTVMALYPDTSCFYRAEVLASPRDLQPGGRTTSSKQIPTYKLKFEDDDDQEHAVAAQWVVEWPGV